MSSKSRGACDLTEVPNKSKVRRFCRSHYQSFCQCGILTFELSWRPPKSPPLTVRLIRYIDATYHTWASKSFADLPSRSVSCTYIHPQFICHESIFHKADVVWANLFEAYRLEEAIVFSIRPLFPHDLGLYLHSALDLLARMTFTWWAPCMRYLFYVPRLSSSRWNSPQLSVCFLFTLFVFAVLYLVESFSGIYPHFFRIAPHLVLPCGQKRVFFWYVAWIGLMTTLRIFLSIDMLIERMRGLFFPPFSADQAGIRAEEMCANGITGGCNGPAGSGGMVAGLILYFLPQ